MPSVSKNAVTNPMAVCSAVGMTSPPRTTATIQTTAPIARPTKRSVLTSINQLVRVGFGQVNRGAADLLHRSGKQRADGGSAVGGHASISRKHRHRVSKGFYKEGIVVTAHGLRRLRGNLLTA